MTEEEYINQLSNIIAKAFNGNWTNDNIGAIEELQANQRLLISEISTVIAMLVNQKVLALEKLRSSFENGFLIKEVIE